MLKEEKIKRLYAKLPKIKCQKKCTQACGPILMSTAEKKIIVKRVGKDPFADIKMPMDEESYVKNFTCLSCPLLKDGECTVYDIRPAVCRLFGLVKKMECPHGCKPDRWVTDKEAHKLLKELNRI